MPARTRLVAQNVLRAVLDGVPAHLVVHLDEQARGHDAAVLADALVVEEEVVADVLPSDFPLVHYGERAQAGQHEALQQLASEAHNVQISADFGTIIKN